MNRVLCATLLGSILGLAAACGDGGADGAAPPSGSAGSSGAAAGGGAGGSAGGGAAGAAGGTAGSAGAAAGSGGASGAAGGGPGPTCEAAWVELMTPIDQVSTGEVTVVASSGGKLTVFVDASAGGSAAAAQNPRVYLRLSDGTRAELSDDDARTSTSWDLSLKRAVLFANGGDGGPGQGAAAVVEGKPFDAVSASDATLSEEDFLSPDCFPAVDGNGSVVTTFSTWYDYNPSTHVLSPRDVVYLVRGGDGALYKLEIVAYYANPDGTTGQAGGRYLLDVAPL